MILHFSAKFALYTYRYLQVQRKYWQNGTLVLLASFTLAMHKSEIAWNLPNKFTEIFRKCVNLCSTL